MREDALPAGELKPTKEPYAIVMTGEIKLCESCNPQYVAINGEGCLSLMPTKLYGPGDKYHSKNSHAISSLIRRCHEDKSTVAPSIAIWGAEMPRLLVRGRHGCCKSACDATAQVNVQPLHRLYEESH